MGGSLRALFLRVCDCPDVTDEEEKVRGRAFLFLMLHIGKMGMCNRGRCEACWWFPDVADEEENVRERLFLLLM